LQARGYRTDALPQSEVRRQRGSSGGPTYNIENMVGSAIQHGTRDSHLTVNYDPKGADFKAFIDHLKTAIPKLELEPEKKNQIYVDIGTIEVQIGALAPKRSIITESIQSIRNILEGMVGSVLASNLLLNLNAFIPK
jgi:hypothetical protein